MMIWGVLILTSIWSFASGALAGNHAQVAEATRQALKRNGFSASSSYTGCFLAVTAWLITACWVVYAFQVGDWRFAAIALVPKVAGLFVYITRPKAG